MGTRTENNSLESSARDRLHPVLLHNDAPDTALEDCKPSFLLTRWTGFYYLCLYTFSLLLVLDIEAAHCLPHQPRYLKCHGSSELICCTLLFVLWLDTTFKSLLFSDNNQEPSRDKTECGNLEIMTACEKEFSARQNTDTNQSSAK